MQIAEELLGQRVTGSRCCFTSGATEPAYRSASGADDCARHGSATPLGCRPPPFRRQVNRYCSPPSPMSDPGHPTSLESSYLFPSSPSRERHPNVKFNESDLPRDSAPIRSSEVARAGRRWRTWSASDAGASLARNSARRSGRKGRHRPGMSTCARLSAGSGPPRPGSA